MASQPSPSSDSDNRPPHRHWQAAVRPHWTEIILTVALVVVGIAQVIIYRGQLTIMGTQADIADAANKQNAVVNRAFVYPKEINFIGPGSGLTENGEWNAILTWENSGNTQTVDLSLVSNYHGDRAIQQWPQFLNFNDVEKRPAFLGPKATTFTVQRILPEHFEAIRTGKLFPFIFARATYKDAISGTEHLTRACWEFFRVPTGVDTQPQRSFMPLCKIHNCADKECEREDQLHPEAAPQ
jgi:hypothetical protein